MRPFSAAFFFVLILVSGSLVASSPINQSPSPRLVSQQQSDIESELLAASCTPDQIARSSSECSGTLAAISERHQEHLANYQLLFTSIETILVLITIAFTARAAISADRSAQAAELSILSSDKALQHARLASERELRAYIHTFVVQHPKFDNTSWDTVVKIENYGQTPAGKVRFLAGHGVKTYPAIDLSNSIADASNPDGSDAPLGPRQSVQAPFKYTPTASERDLVKRGESFRYYIFGNITYEDAFGNMRRTSFQLMFGGEPSMLAGMMIQCAAGNDFS